ncbi:hypothetical protein K439DRAFT_1641281 [Ramaria rubella]|nr:hypothetical protein K439DRAFT_1641281 [Ramaria rubella]
MRCISVSTLGALVVLFAAFGKAWSSNVTTSSPWLINVFSFTWTPPIANVSVPTTAQCDSINITWTPENNGSPDPVPPYFLQVYTSTLTYPIIVPAGSFSPFEWAVPFPPSTQYQICMFDSRGRSGGCQESYTVIPPTNSSRKCNNPFTTPNILTVEGSTETGPLTEFGWPDQCTTISLSAKNGTPPFIMTVAPSYHPPLNLTFSDLGPMDWTVTLAWGMQFWISLVDAAGATWAFGPLHSGGNGPTDCLILAGSSLSSQSFITTASHEVSAGATVGIAFGALVFGIIITLALQWMWSCRRKRGRNTSSELLNEHEPATRPAISSSMSEVEPYHIPAAVRSQQQIEARSSESENQLTSVRNDSQVYVVHHDAGGVPVTIFTGGRDVRELPPNYTRTSSEPRGMHTPSTSMDSTSRSSGVRRQKSSTPLRSVTS